MGGKEGGHIGKQGGMLREFAGKKTDSVVLWMEGVTVSQVCCRERGKGRETEWEERRVAHAKW